MTEQHGLGRIPSKPHPRMAEFPIEAILTPQEYPRSYTWDCDLWLNQGGTSECVPHSWGHEAAARPVERKDITSTLVHRMYGYAQQHDYWPGENYDGTSVDGGAQAARHEGLIESWWWARNLETALVAIGHKGPAVLGFDWWTGMFTPDRYGWLSMTGAIEGGHAVLATQVRVTFKKGTAQYLRRSSGWSAYLDHDKSWVGIHNSWGEDWQPRQAGQPVPARIRIPEFSALIQSGEVCVPVGRLKAK